jgi:hypothetical protein
MEKSKKIKEESNMKKTLLYMCLILMSVVLVYGYADAISGQCSNCHTMHNSQDGAPVTISGTPNEQLLNAGCVACHTTTTGQTTSFGAPAILHTTAPAGQGNSFTLAGGDFHWVNNNEVGLAVNGHNVIDLPGVTGKDTNMPNLSPPGWDPVATSSSFVAGQVAGGEATWTSQLTCAGQYGCHGDHTQAGSFPGMTGAHHENENTTATRAQLATTIGNSYRFLWGIKGLEDPNWNWGEVAATHNEYYGEDNTADRTAGGLAAYGSRDTISFLCAECHGIFHGTIDSATPSGSPWIRHPTDILLPNSGEYAEYNNDGGGSAGPYSLEAPVARPTVPATSSSTVTPGTDIIMCLSCHRAHGAPLPDFLRWNYALMIAGGGNTTGCFTCHTAKN